MKNITNKPSKTKQAPSHKVSPEIRDNLDSRERKENTPNKKKNETPFSKD
ncbi:MAG: hypothetical protein K0R51_5 [Cytophagaceae bacterium]|jgi:hypothetical protein|nr:hypothetical protein [Cytophagaceae bacterium]